MITIKPNGSWEQGFIVEGHAEYAEHGRDIVCASVSVLTQMVANEIVDQLLGVKEMYDGYLKVTVHFNTGGYVSSLMHMLIGSLRQIEQQYPEHVKVM